MEIQKLNTKKTSLLKTHSHNLQNGIIHFMKSFLYTWIWGKKKQAQECIKSNQNKKEERGRKCLNVNRKENILKIF